MRQCVRFFYAFLWKKEILVLFSKRNKLRQASKEYFSEASLSCFNLLRIWLASIISLETTRSFWFSVFNWNVLKMGSALFEMCSLRNVHHLEYAQTERCSNQYVLKGVIKLECDQNGIWPKWNMLYHLKCAQNGMWPKLNVIKMECDQNGMWSKWNLTKTECAQNRMFKKEIFSNLI